MQIIFVIFSFLNGGVDVKILIRIQVSKLLSGDVNCKTSVCEENFFRHFHVHLEFGHHIVSHHYLSGVQLPTHLHLLPNMTYNYIQRGKKTTKIDIE